ncbi:MULTISPECIES: copper homeostasis protein CutC [Paenibacillus]|uniref:copper homeostasis protein CutC n=1 Tax=Paenibacillus TaxID=44249 RepID=UPI0022B89B32|nr:copper homeostasis protein CutC [Paenibacillus caseinilyticus]MCZ8520479.1 copper homeostasis protein CutC [Paenibacillus caseinilyticus]
MLLEVIAETREEAVTAARYGADRIEFIADYGQGGLTPDLEHVRETAAAVDIPVHVMVRPHSRSFRYEADELQGMVRDIRSIRTSGARGIVIGALTESGMVDEAALERLLDAAGDLSVTFHRAFDEIEDQPAALETLLIYPGIRRVLTSGGRPSAFDAQERIRTLAQRCRGTGVSILAGSGLRLEGLEAFLRETGVEEVHFGSWVRYGADPAQEIDPERMRALKRVLARF